MKKVDTKKLELDFTPVNIYLHCVSLARNYGLPLIDDLKKFGDPFYDDYAFVRCIVNSPVTSYSDPEIRDALLDTALDFASNLDKIDLFEEVK